MKQELTEALKRLARGHVDAAEVVAELLMPEPKTVDVAAPLADLQAALDAGAVADFDKKAE